MDLQKILIETETIFADCSFDDAAKIEAIMAPMPDYDLYLADKKALKTSFKNKENIAEWKVCGTEPQINLQQQQHLFRQYNYLKYVARKAALEGNISQAQNFLQQACKIREIISLTNMRLAANVAKTIRTRYKNDITAEAYARLLIIIEKFDWRRKLTFSTYATMALKHFLWKMNSKFHYHSNFEEEKLKIRSYSKELSPEIIYQKKLHVKLLRKLIKTLPPRDREIIEMRYGIPGGEEKTLKECGAFFKVTRERIRQIEARVLRKLAEDFSSSILEVA